MITYKMNRSNDRIIVRYDAYCEYYDACIDGSWNGRILSIEKPHWWDNVSEEKRKDYLMYFESVYFEQPHKVVRTGAICH